MLPDYPHLIFFLTATLLLNLTPGNDVLYIASQSVSSSRQGVLAALGSSVGAAIYIMATAFGLSEVFRHSPLAFDLIKIVGGIYLIYLAWKAFFKNQPIALGDGSAQKTGMKSFYMGTFTTLLNPKVGIFFITFLPQFTDSGRGKLWLQILSLGACFMLSATLINLMYALLIGHLKERLFAKSSVQVWLNKATGLVFCVLAFKVLTTKQN
jgi:threonine/homoserine/homoserine lactone efflux protein